MNDFNWSLETIARREGGSLLHGFCFRPHPGIWPAPSADADVFSRHRKEIRAKLPGYGDLLDAFLTASYLLDPAAFPEGAVRGLYSRLALGAPFSWDELLARRWMRIPILTASSHGGDIVYALLGYGVDPCPRPWPKWADKLLDDQARCSVRSAMELHSRHADQLFFWPMLDFRTDSPLLIGGSLGLAVYLGFASLIHGEDHPPLAATGVIQPNGALQAVHDLRHKIRAASEKDIAGVLHPKGCDAVDGDGYATEAVAVEDLAVAEALWRRHSAGCLADMAGFLTRAKDEHILATSLMTTPRSLLSWLETKKSCIQYYIVDHVKDRDLLQDILHHIRVHLDDPDWPDDILAVVLDILDKDLVGCIGEFYPARAFDYCLLHVVEARASGDILKARDWLEFIEAYVPHKDRHQEHEDHKIYLHVLQQVCTRHNRYCFAHPCRKPEGDLGLVISKYRGSFQKRRRMHAQSEANAVSLTLGRLYETMAADLAFGRAKRWELIRRYARLARGAFGDGKLPDAKDHHLRQFRLLFFAALDAGLQNEAESYLNQYLEVDRLDDFHPRNLDNPFQHHAMARFLAATSGDHEEYLDWCASLVKVEEWEIKQHPWQLWLYNLGRRFHDEDTAACALRHSRTACLHRENHTANPMALLPLAELERRGLEDRRELEQITVSVLQLIQGLDIDTAHFECVLTAGDWRESLDKVRVNRARLFPFTFR